MNGEENSRVSFKERYFTAKNITYFAILLALVIVLQMFGAAFKIGGTSLNFVLVPVVLCGMILGSYSACLLGFISGLIIYLQGVFGADAFTAILINDHPVITAIVCLGKGAMCGLVAGFVYKLIAKKNSFAASFVASALCPTVNTALFIIGALFMSDTISTNFLESGETVIYFLVIVCAGINYLVELAINLICAPAVLKIKQVIEKTIKSRG